MVVEGPRGLPPLLEEKLFNARLVAIWQGLLKADVTEAWRDALAKKPHQEWLQSISQSIPEDVRKILGGLQPATLKTSNVCHA